MTAQPELPPFDDASFQARYMEVNGKLGHYWSINQVDWFPMPEPAIHEPELPGELDKILQKAVQPETALAFDRKNEALAAISRLISEVIGEPEKHPLEARIDTDEEHGYHLGYLDGQNDLKAAQRRRLEGR